MNFLLNVVSYISEENTLLVKLNTATLVTMYPLNNGMSLSSLAVTNIAPLEHPEVIYQVCLNKRRRFAASRLRPSFLSCKESLLCCSNYVYKCTMNGRIHICTRALLDWVIGTSHALGLVAHQGFHGAWRSACGTEAACCCLVCCSGWFSRQKGFN